MNCVCQHTVPVFFHAMFILELSFSYNFVVVSLAYSLSVVSGS